MWPQILAHKRGGQSRVCSAWQAAASSSTHCFRARSQDTPEQRSVQKKIRTDLSCSQSLPPACYTAECVTGTPKKAGSSQSAPRKAFQSSSRLSSNGFRMVLTALSVDCSSLRREFQTSSQTHSQNFNLCWRKNMKARSLHPLQAHMRRHLWHAMPPCPQRVASQHMHLSRLLNVTPNCTPPLRW